MAKPLPIGTVPALRQLIDEISDKINCVDDYVKGRSIYDMASAIAQTKYREDQMRQYLEAVIRDYPRKNARMTDSANATALFILGVRTTCTSGYYNLAKNWLRAAQREIARIEGGSHEAQ
jgi:hypothetical protein